MNLRIVKTILAAGLISQAFTSAAATKIWDGSVSSGWSVAGNWSNNVAPLNGDALIFPENAVNKVVSQTTPVSTNFTSLTLNGADYAIVSTPLSLTNGLTNAVAIFNSANTLRAILQPRANQTWTVGGRNTLNLESNVTYASLTLTLNVAGVLDTKAGFGGAGAVLSKLGPGRVILRGAGSFSELRAGVGAVEANGTLTTGSLVVSNGAVLAGNGTVSPFTCAGEVRLGPNAGTDTGVLTVSAGTVVFQPGGLLQAKLFGAAPGTGHDQLRVSTPPNLANGALRLTRTSGVTITNGQRFVIITNTGAAAFTTTFTNLPQGAFITNLVAPATVFQISYTGGSGNDVELTAVSVAVSPTGITAVWDGDGQPNRDWTNALNWAGNNLPAQGDSLIFPASVALGRRATRNSFTNTPTFNRLTFADSTGDAWSINGNPFKLIGGIVSTGAPTLGSLSIVAPTRLELTAPQTFAATNSTISLSTDLALEGHSLTLAPGAGGTVSLGLDNISSGQMVKVGEGTLLLSTRFTPVTGALSVTMNSGETIVSGAFTNSGNWLLNGGRLELHSAVIPNVAVNNGTLSPNLTSDTRATNAIPGSLTLSAASTFEVPLTDPTDKFGSPLTLLHVGGGAALNNAALSVLAPDLSFIGSTFLVIGQPGATAFQGIFAGKPEGTVFVAPNRSGFLLPLRISYVGGDGNDLTLTVLAPTPSGVTREWNGLGADEFWSTAGNWLGGVAPTGGDAVSFPVAAAQRTNENDQPVFLDAITWLGSGYSHHGATALLGGLRAGHASGTNELLGNLVAIGSQTWTVSNAAAVLRISGETGIGPAAAGAGFDERGGILALGDVMKTGPGTLHLPAIRIQMAGRLIVNGGTVQMSQASISGGLNETNGGLDLIQGVLDVSESAAQALRVTGGEVVSRLVLDSGAPVRSGFAADTIEFLPGTALTVVGTNRFVTGAALISLELAIAGVRFNAQLPPGLPRGQRITVAHYGSPLTGTFAGLPEGSVTNFNGNFVLIRYADTLPNSEGLFVTLTVLSGPPPRFTGIVRVNPTTLILQGRGAPGELITLEGTTDFVNWTALGTTVAGVDDFGFVVNPTTPAFRFFRLVMP